MYLKDIGICQIKPLKNLPLIIFLKQVIKAISMKKDTFFIVGRNKDMIITGGLNVYPKEVETYIDQIEGVNESAVIGLKDGDFGEKVVAIVVLDAKSNLKEAQIIENIKESIAGFKVPKEVIFMDELPRNAMGKVQKIF